MQNSTRLILILTAIIMLLSGYLLADKFGLWAGIFFILLNLYLFNRDKIIGKKNRDLDALDHFQLSFEENTELSDKEIILHIKENIKPCPDCSRPLIPGLPYCEECGRRLG